MQVLEIILWLALAGGILLGLLILAPFLKWFVFMLVAYIPGCAGVASGVNLWGAGHDNLAVIIGIAGILVNIWWHDWLDKKWDVYGEPTGSSYNPMADKKKRYDKAGNVVGYEDRD